MSGPEAAAFMSFVGCATYVVVRVTNAVVRRLELRHGAPPAGAAQGARLTGNLEERLTRIEQAVDAIAVEVERISEGQRFVTRVLSERDPLRLPAEKR